MAIIYTNNVYFIKAINANRFCIVFENDILCKYDNNKDGVKEMVEDFIGFAVEDKIITTRQQKEVKAMILEAIKNF